MLNDSVGKMVRSMWKDGQSKNQRRRNSPRLSALNATNKETKQTKTIASDEEAFEKEECYGEKQTPPSQTKAKAKRKFSHLAAKQVFEGRGKVQQREDRSTNNGIASKLPEKRILELILDILQRRDGYEIFAEPVDPKEVEDYYEIIKDPMDFGTMRAKLHEGMYENLEQFEHDAFLIPENAMNFNSSGTIYFRQARCIYDLAKKVFHVLRTDPGNFEMEFSGTRRRSVRKMQNETTKESKPQRDVNVKPDNARADAAPNSALFCLGVPSTLAMSSRESPRFASLVAQTNKKDHAFFLGTADAQRSLSAEGSRRSTYLTWKSSLENECPKPSILLNELKINYTESLTRFVEDLGPTAKRIATRKLQGLQPKLTTFQTPSYQVPTAYATFRMPSSIQKLPDSLTNFTSVMNANKDISGANKQKGSNKTTATGSIVQYKRNNRRGKEKRTESSISPIANSSEDLNSPAALKKISGSKKPAGSSVIVDTRKPKDSKLRPVVLALEQPSHANVPAELKPRNKRSNSSQNKANGKAEVAKDQNQAAGSRENNTALQPPATAQSSELQPIASLPFHLPPKPFIPRFTFDMPFLKAQLHQMNPAAAQMNPLDSRLFEATRFTPPSGSYFRFGGVTSLMNRPLHQDEHQQIPIPTPFIYTNNQPSWHSLAPPLDSDLSLQL